MSYPVGRDVYEGYIVGEIYCEAGNEYVSFTSKPDNPANRDSRR